MLLFLKNKALGKQKCLPWVRKHTYAPDRPKEELSILQDNLDDQVQKNINICVRRDKTTFVGITIVSTHMTWILLTQVQETRSGFGLEFTLMIIFGTMVMWSNGIWAYSLLPIDKY